MSIISSTQALNDIVQRFQTTKAEIAADKTRKQDYIVRVVEQARVTAEQSAAIEMLTLWGRPEWTPVAGGAYVGVLGIDGEVWRTLANDQVDLQQATRSAERAGIDSGFLAHETNRVTAILEEAAQAHPTLGSTPIDYLEEAYRTGNPELRYAFQDLFVSKFRYSGEMDVVHFRSQLIADRIARVKDNAGVVAARNTLFATVAAIVAAYNVSMTAVNALSGAATSADSYLSIWRTAVALGVRDVFDNGAVEGGKLVTVKRLKFGTGANVQVDENGVFSAGGNIDRTVQTYQVLVTDQAYFRLMTPSRMVAQL